MLVDVLDAVAKSRAYYSIENRQEIGEKVSKQNLQGYFSTDDAHTNEDAEAVSFC